MIPIRYLILALTTRCNLHCRYCYYWVQHFENDMTSDVIRRAISLAVSGGQPFHLQLTGGEPVLVPGMVEEAAALAHDAGQCFSIGIQTNGTCLTSDLIAIIKKYQMEVGVSLDGPPVIHEQQRGRASETFRGLQLLERENILIRLRERDLLMTAGENKRGTFCHACLAESIAVSPDGKIFPCGQTLGDEQIAAGTIRAPELENLKILQECKPDHTACSTCVLENICPGDCPSRIYYNRNIKGITSCDIYRTLWQLENHFP